MKFTSELLKATIFPEEKYCFFWHGPLSQWAKGNFYCSSLKEEVNCAEQAMMLSKAKLFNDMETYEKIKSTQSQKEQKALGRTVKNFDEELWTAHRIAIVTMINVDKFRASKESRELLLLTHPWMLVEASPNDSIWGIGMDVNNPKLLISSLWGQNLLGKALVSARSILLREQVENQHD